MLRAVLRKWIVVGGLLSVSALSWGELHDPSAAPEPGSASLVGIALVAAIYIATRKRK
mgnify:CR=1 FL=1